MTEAFQGFVVKKETFSDIDDASVAASDLYQMPESQHLKLITREDIQRTRIYDRDFIDVVNGWFV